MAVVQIPALNFEDGGLHPARHSHVEDDADASESAGSDLDGSDLDNVSEPDTPQASDEPQIPVHPISYFQDAFAESLDEVTNSGGVDKPKLKALDAKARRNLLLSQSSQEQPFDARWRYRPGQTQHEVTKLIAQISFGIYLLLNGMANDNAQVVDILQGHIDEVDEFLMVALEDQAEAVDDLTQRINLLKLPMANMKQFEELLEDRIFRADILDGNEKIDAILDRTNVAVKQWDDDIEAGLRSSAHFAKWLHDEKSGDWREEQPDLVDVFDAMTGNSQGWITAFDRMNDRAQDINSLIITLMNIVTEMESKAGEVSRRNHESIQPFSTPTNGLLRRQSVTTPLAVPSLRSIVESTEASSSKTPTQLDTSSTRDGERLSDIEDDENEFELPGGLPLLPPSGTNFARRSNLSVISRRQEHERNSSSSESPLYVLQPRTYTPQPPAPLPSPMVKGNMSPSSPARRVSLQGEAPVQPHVPTLRHRPSQAPEMTRMSTRSVRDSASMRVQSPVIGSPVVGSPVIASPVIASPVVASPRTMTSMARNSSYGSDASQSRQHPRVNSQYVAAPSGRRDNIPSPYSDYQAFQPMHIPPHSPVPQRPHTASGTGRAVADGNESFHHKNKPSQLGGMSTLSNVTLANSDDGAASTISQAGNRTLKKKKSAFGWIKKAFTMDDSERAAFEARKLAQLQPRTYQQDGPRFLDGRRIR